MSTPQPNKYNTNPLSGTGSPGNENNTSGKLPSYYYDPQNSGSNDNSMNPQYDQNRSRIDDDRRSTSNSFKSQPITGANMNADEMLGKIVQFGKDSYTIKAYLQCEEEGLFALECERPMIGFDGRCPKCGRQHVPLDKTRGFYASEIVLLRHHDQKPLNIHNSKECQYKSHTVLEHLMDKQWKIE
ncbi:unnamed protein product [Rotaria sp. Silwood2]|nr:unnamed protein product [Rotaria sp. Silwood2]